MLKIGLTGGIGAGKTTVAQIFKILGAPVFDADSEAKRIMNEDEQLKQNIITSFGGEAYIGDKLNKTYVADIVFNNTHQLEKLNALVHPIVIKNAEDWMQQQQTAFVIKEAALMFESGSAANLDYVIGVFAPIDIRIKRVVMRDNTTRENVLSRMRNQVEDNIKMKLCDFIIINDDVELLTPQIINVYKKITG